MRDNTSRRATVTLLLLVWLAATLLAVSACNDETDAAAPAASPPTPSLKVIKSGPLSKLETPATVIAYGGSDDPGQLMSALQLLSGEEETAKERLGSSAETLAKKYKLADPAVLALDKPIRVAALDPKTFADPVVLIVATSDRNAFIKALPPEAKPDDKGNAFAYPLSASRSSYVNFVDPYVVFTGHEDAFPKHQDFIAKLVGASLPAALGAVVAVDRLSALFKKEIDNAVGRANKRAKKAAGGGKTANASIARLTSWTGGMIHQVKRAQLQLSPSGTATRVHLEVEAVDGSELEKTLTGLGGRKLDILSRMPRNASAALAIDMDPDSDSDLAQTMAAWLLQLSPIALSRGAADEPDAAYLSAMRAFWKATDGQLGFAIHAVGDQLAYSSVFGVRDEAGARAAMGKARAMVQDDDVAQLYKQLGMAISYEPGAYRVKGVSIDRVNAKAVEPAGGGSALALKQALGGRAGFFVDLMNSHLALRESSGVMSYGKDGRKTIEAWLSDAIEGGLDQQPDIARLRKDAAKTTFAIGWGLPTQLLSMLPGMAGGKGDAHAAAEPAAEPAAGSGVGVVFGATKTALHVDVVLPADEGQALVKLLSGFGGAW